MKNKEQLIRSLYYFMGSRKKVKSCVTIDAKEFVIRIDPALEMSINGQGVDSFGEEFLNKFDFLTNGIKN